MLLQIHLQNYGLFRTAVPYRRASEPRSYRLPLPLQISPSLSFGHVQPELQAPLRRNQHRGSTSALFLLLLPLRLHEQYVPPAIKIHGNVRTDVSLSPILRQSTTDYILLANRGKTECHFYRSHRIMSRMSDVHKDVPPAHLILRVSPTLPPGQSLLHDPSLFQAGSPE